MNEREYLKGTHCRFVGENICDLIKDGYSEYKILRPKAGDRDNCFKDDIDTVFAVEELNFFYFLATGNYLDVIYDESVVLTDESKYIAVGATKFTEDILKIDKTLLSGSGYKIKTHGKSVFISGANPEGTIFGVYDFLRTLFGYRFYAKDEFKVNRVQNLALPKMDILELPDYEWREGGLFGDIPRDIVVNKRFRFNKTGSMYLFGHDCHNSFKVLPPARYFDTKPDWYTLNKFGEPGQLCYSNREMIAEYIKNLKLLIANNCNKLIFLGIEDNHLWCTCESCLNSKEKYSTNAAVVVKFINRVSREINAYVKQEKISDFTLKFLIFAYYATNDAPVVKSDGKYIPIDADVKLDDNIGIMYAPGGADFTKSFLAKENSHYYSQLKKWNAITNKIHIWTYPLYAFNYLVFYPFSFAMQENYKIWLNNGVCCLLDQTQHEQCNYSVFARLQVFLQSELAWNVNADLDALTDEFFENYFKEAASGMRIYYDDILCWYKHLEKTTDFKGLWGFSLVDAKYFSKEKLDEWEEVFNHTYETVAKILDLTLRNRILNRVKTEHLSVNFLQIEIYGDKLVKEELLEKKREFYKDFTSLGLQRINEIVLIEELWKRWGLQ